MRAFESKDIPLIDRLAAGWRGWLIVALTAALCALPGLTRVAPLDRDESRYAQATAQMLETGDYVRLYVQEDPRHKKPAGVHWLQAASVAAVSDVEARAIWAYRLPSLAGAVLAVLALFWGGVVLVGRRAAFVGALGLGASLLMSTEGMIAKTDALLAGFVVLALAAIARLRMRPVGAAGGRGLALLAWIALAAGILIKGPIAPMVVGLTVAALVLWEREHAWTKPLLWWPGPALATALALPWFVAIGVATNGEYFLEAIGHDLGAKVTASAEHPAMPPGLHTLLVPLLIFPLTLGVPAAVRLAWAGARAPRRDETHAGLRFLLAWAIPSLAVFEAAPVKLVHYTLPVYPALALLAGAGLVAAFARPWPRTLWVGLGLLAFAGALLVTLAGAVSTFAPPVGAGALEGWAGPLLTEANPRASPEDVRRAVQIWILGGAGLAIAAVVLALRRTLVVWTATFVLLGAAAMWAIRGEILPEARELTLSAEASAALDRAGLHPRLDGAGRLFVVGYSEPSLVFLTRTDSVLAIGEIAGQTAPDGAAILLEARHAEAFEDALRARGLAFRPQGPAVTGLNYSNGDETTLQPGRIVPAQP